MHRAGPTGVERLAPANRNQCGMVFVRDAQELFRRFTDAQLEMQWRDGSAVAAQERLGPGRRLMVHLVGERGNARILEHVDADEIAVLRADEVIGPGQHRATLR